MRKAIMKIFVVICAVAVGMPVIAGTVTPPASGHPFYESQREYFEVFDNHVINGNMMELHWATPLATPTSKGTVQVFQTAAYTKSAVFSFNANGTVYDWTSYTTNSSLGTVDVPSTGSVFVRSNLIGDCLDCHQQSKLSSIRWY